MKLTLHAGAGKTGSTAIQDFFSRNHDNLKKYGVLYPNPKVGVITSGNGSPISASLRASNDLKAKRFIEVQIKKAENLGIEHIVLSSESFSGLGKNYLKALKVMVEDNFSDVNCIIYVRNPFDWTYSAWMQHVKRHLVTEPFDSYYPKLARKHLQSVCRFLDVFKDSKVVSYDANKRNLIENFLQHANIPSEGLNFSASQSVVNRSLTEKEIGFMLEVNKLITSPKLGTKISDFLIQTYPATETSACIDEKIKQDIFSVNEPELRIINQVIQAGQKIC